MTLQRREVRAGRTLAAIGALVTLVGCVLPWWRLGGDRGIPAIGGNAFEASGILVFMIAVMTLALVVLPYAVGDRPTALDRWISYAVLAGLGWFGLAWRVLDLLTSGALRFDQPAQAVTNGPGLWIAALGLGMLARAAYRMSRAPAYR